MDNIDYIFLYAMLLAVLFFVWAMMIAKNEKEKQKTYVLNELKKIKLEFNNKNEFEYKRIENKKLIFIMILVIAIIITSGTFLLFIIDKKYYWLAFIPVATFSITAYIKMSSSVRNIMVTNSSLNIKYYNYNYEYNLNDIEEIRIKDRVENRTRNLYLYIKKKEKAKYDIHSLSAYSTVSKMIATAIFIKLLKENNIEIIDTITEEEIDNIKKEITV